MNKNLSPKVFIGLFIFLLIFLVINLFIPFLVKADYDVIGNPLAGVNDTGKEYDYYTKGVDLAEVIGVALGVAIQTVGAIVFAIAVYAGFIWLTANGNEEKITKAKKTLFWAFLGLVVIFGAYSILSFVISNINQAVTVAQ